MPCNTCYISLTAADKTASRCLRRHNKCGESECLSCIGARLTDDQLVEIATKEHQLYPGESININKLVHSVRPSDAVKELASTELTADQKDKMGAAEIATVEAGRAEAVKTVNRLNEIQTRHTSRMLTVMKARQNPYELLQLPEVADAY